MQIIWLQHVAACRQGKVKQVYINSKYGYSILLDTINLFDSNTVHSKCINDHTLRSDIFLPKCPTHSREMSDKFESTLSKSHYLVGHRGRTWEWIYKDLFTFLEVDMSNILWSMRICKRTFFPVCRMSGYVNTLVYFYLAPYSHQER